MIQSTGRDSSKEMCHCALLRELGEVVSKRFMRSIRGGFMFIFLRDMLLIEWSVTVTVTVTDTAQIGNLSPKPEPFRLSKASKFDHSEFLLGEWFFWDRIKESGY